jgi:hypothetical protein
MADRVPFAEVLEAVEGLSFEDQEALLLIVHRRLAEQGRKRVVADAGEARQEFLAGGARPVSVDELMGELLS